MVASTQVQQVELSTELGGVSTSLSTQAAEVLELDRLLAAGAIRSAYQPIVELYTGATVAYEALARAPKGSPLERPDVLFAAARRAGRVTELDRACQNAATTGAREAGLKAPWTLFVNVEPESASATLLGSSATSRATSRATGEETDGATEEAPESAAPTTHCPVVVELTERALIAQPAELLALVSRIRARGWGIALDDVGANPDSLALLPLLQPDVIKLDLRLVQQRATSEIARIVTAVNAEAERSGSAVLAEGIETTEHRDIALALGASLGQGWLLGRPVGLPYPLPTFTGTSVPVNVERAAASTRSPFALVAASRSPRRSRKALLIEMSKHLEAQALTAGESAVVLATFQDASFFTPATRRRYAHLVAHTTFVGVFGKQMPAVPMEGVRGTVLAPDDPLVGEWDIAVVGPHYAATLVARDLGSGGPGMEREFEFVLSHDRALAIEVALALISRVQAPA